MAGMTQAPTRTARPLVPQPDVPPLENGDNLTADEFHRRYLAMPHIGKAELIEGIVYMPSPVSLAYHGQPHFHVITWMGYYVSKTPGLIAGDNATARLDKSNEPQPDVLLMLPPQTGGKAYMDEWGYVHGAPELVVEVAASSASIDLNKKKRAYLRNGVREYLVWRMLDDQVDWFELQEDAYEPVPTDGGLLKSRVFPGLWLDVEAVLAGDLAKAFAAVDRGCATDEHAAFVKRLAP